MVNIVFNHLVILVIVLQILFVVSGSNTSKLISFSTYLIHRDSFESPLYNSSIDKTSLIDRAIRRSNSRLSHRKSISKFSNNAGKEINAIDSTIGISLNYEFLIEIFIGTPPIKQLAIFDSGSDVVWTQCLPCIQCFKQTQPKFNSKRSSSYERLKCGDKQCIDLGDDKTCTSQNSKCKYTLDYMDHSTSSGDLALETFKLGNTFFQNMVYGCSKNNIGLFDEEIAGVVGFGSEPNSLISQLRDRVGGKFSYCLVHHSDPITRSKINFGADAIVYGQSTPMESYYVTLEGISVQNVAFRRDQNIYTTIPYRSQALLDTGSFLSYLPPVLYEQLIDALRSMIHAEIYEGLRLKHCYAFYPNFPSIIYHFLGGAQLVLTMENTIIKQHGNLWCLTIHPTDEDDDDI